MIKNTPFGSALVALLVIGAIVLTPLDTLFPKIHFSDFHIEYLVLTIKMSLLFIFGFSGILKLKIQVPAGLKSSYNTSKWYLNIFPIYLFLIGISTFIGKDLSQIEFLNLALLLFACLMVGFGEEFIFRGFLQPLFLKKYIHHKRGIFLGVFFPALCFGLSHLFNLVVNDNIPQVVFQVIYATFIGFYFGVTLLNTQKLIPIAITHGLINFFFLFSSLPGLLDETAAEVTPNEVSIGEQIAASVGSLIIFIPLLVLGLIFIRKIKKEAVIQMLEK